MTEKKTFDPLLLENQLCFPIYACARKIVAAYNLLRDQKARKDYGYAFVQCSDEQKEKLRQAIPQRISEIYQTVEKRGENGKEGAQ